MNTKVKDLMVQSVITTVPHKSVGHVKELMHKHHIKSIPIVNGDHEIMGIVTSSDFMTELSPHSPVKQIMTTKVYTIPLYSDVHIAARVMRNHHIHHLVVTDEKKVVGVLSSFDLLKLVEDHRFIMKNGPTPSRKKTKRQ